MFKIDFTINLEVKDIINKNTKDRYDLLIDAILHVITSHRLKPINDTKCIDSVTLDAVSIDGSTLYFDFELYFDDVFDFNDDDIKEKFKKIYSKFNAELSDKLIKIEFGYFKKEIKLNKDRILDDNFNLLDYTKNASWVGYEMIETIITLKERLLDKIHSKGKDCIKIKYEDNNTIIDYRDYDIFIYSYSIFYNDFDDVGYEYGDIVHGNSELIKYAKRMDEYNKQKIKEVEKKLICNEIWG